MVAERSRLARDLRVFAFERRVCFGRLDRANEAYLDFTGSGCERVTDRAELNDILGMMVAEVGALHSQVAPGDIRKSAPEGTPSGLGAVLARVATGYRVERVYRSDGSLELAPSFKSLHTSPATYIWSIAADGSSLPCRARPQ